VLLSCKSVFFVSSTLFIRSTFIRRDVFFFLYQAATDLLVHQKQLTVGIPQGGHEEVITRSVLLVLQEHSFLGFFSAYCDNLLCLRSCCRPLPQEEMKNIIFNVFGEDMSTGVVTQVKHTVQC